MSCDCDASWVEMLQMQPMRDPEHCSSGSGTSQSGVTSPPYEQVWRDQRAAEDIWCVLFTHLDEAIQKSHDSLMASSRAIRIAQGATDSVAEIKRVLVETLRSEGIPVPKEFIQMDQTPLHEEGRAQDILGTGSVQPATASIIEAAPIGAEVTKQVTERLPPAQQGNDLRRIPLTVGPVVPCQAPGNVQPIANPSRRSARARMPQASQSVPMDTEAQRPPGDPG
jgi:hypothetical protein